MEKEKQYPLNPEQAKILKATIYDLSEQAAKQALYGIVQMLSIKINLSKNHFEEIIDDARKLTEVKKPRST